MPEEPQAPIEGQPITPTVPEKSGETPIQVPEKFKDKSPEEISKAYDEAQKFISKQGEDLGRTKKEKEELEKQIKNLNYLAQVIESDEDLYKRVEAKIKGTPEDKPTEPDDVRVTITGNVIKEFEQKFGLDKLESEKAQAIRTAIGQKVERLTGRSINDVPLSQLAETLESGYTLATQGDREEQARLQGIAEARANREAEIGSIQSSGVNGTQVTLTPGEKEAARKLGISEIDYIKYK